LIGVSIYLLWDKSNLLFYYTFGIFLNTIINIGLKCIIQQPRPSIDANKFNLVLRNFKQSIFKNGIPDIFGMPSGHTQSVMFSTIFIFLSLKKMNILIFYLIISLITMWQRVNYNFHTINQVIVGFIVGSGFAYFMFYMGKKNKTGVIREKRDDNAII
jgi:membrane-associated phospholipid phosphatase